MALSYRDERSIVRYLLARLEERLAGRHEQEILKTSPSDHCQLGVLVPWTGDPSESDLTEGDDEAAGPESSTAPTQSHQAAHSGPKPKKKVGEREEPGTESVEPFSRPEEASRRPPSSLGCGFSVRPPAEGSGHVEIAVSGSLAIYTRHFPSYEEERRELGSLQSTKPDDAKGSGTQGKSPRKQVTLIEKSKRHRVEIPKIRFSLNPSQISRLEDQGEVQTALGLVLDSVSSDPTLRRDFVGRQVVPAEALRDETAYAAFLDSVQGPKAIPPLAAAVRVNARPIADGLRIAIYLCNKTRRDGTPARDQYRALTDAALEVEIVRGTLVPVELLPVPEDYQYDRRVWAVGRNTSVEVSDDHRFIRTRAMGRYEQPRLTTSERVAATYESLAADPFGILEKIRIAMSAYGNEWKQEVVDGNALNLAPAELQICSQDLNAFEREVDGFTAGIAALAADPRLEKAFRAMNWAFAGGRFDRWRLFQIVFIVSQLPALTIREGHTEGEWPIGTARSWPEVLDRVDVLWFPTGGGKTEAYLGLISCAALYDRLRGKHCGTTAWLRFPLRMLSVQQLQRAMRVLWKTEQQRLAIARDTGNPELGDPIALGYFVGSANTPNQFYPTGQWSFANLRDNPRQRDKLLLINDCPACGTEGSVAIELDEPLRRVRHVCSACKTELPVYVSDEEIYRFLPTLIVGTVDKMAAIAYQPKVALLWTGPEWRCSLPEHGYGTGDWCINGCPTNPNVPNPNRIRKQRLNGTYDPAPALHVQDELHLLQEELGTFAGHYETMVRSCEAAASTHPPKVLAATATIEGYEHQAREIYGAKGVRRFPNRGYALLESFYTTADPDLAASEPTPKTARFYAAFRPPYLRAADAATLCAEILHQAINELQADPQSAAALIGLQDTTGEDEVRALLAYYSRTLTYVGARDSGIRVTQSMERHSAQEEKGLRPGQIRELNVEYLSSHSTLREIAETVKRAEADTPWTSKDHLDATVATDVISHGVDVEYYNLMVLERIPEQAAGYIQVSSRSGRQHVGMVLTILPRYSLRAGSIYDRFPEFHRHLDRMVLPVAVNRFAKTAIDRTFPGITVGTVYGRHLFSMKGSKEQRLGTVKQSVGRSSSTGGTPFDAGGLLTEVRASYALNQGVYDQGLERQMAEKVGDLYQRFQWEVKNPSHRDLTEVFKPGPMTSLRDVDVAVPFRPDDAAVDWHDLRWFEIRQG